MFNKKTNTILEGINTNLERLLEAMEGYKRALEQKNAIAHYEELKEKENPAKRKYKRTPIDKGLDAILGAKNVPRKAPLHSKVRKRRQREFLKALEMTRDQVEAQRVSGYSYTQVANWKHGFPAFRRKFNAIILKKITQ